MQSLLLISTLRRARLNLGLTLQELALETGVSASKLSAAERNLVPLSKAEQRVIARALGADVEWLFAPRNEVPS